MANEPHLRLFVHSYSIAARRNGFAMGENQALAKKRFEQQLDALDALKAAEPSPEVNAALAKAMKNSSNYLVAKACRIAGESRIEALLPDVLAAAARFFEDPVKTDPQCWAKIAAIQALLDLGYTESHIFLRGLRHIQKEPVWGGQADTAGPLRAKCAQALVACSGLSEAELLTPLTELLTDEDKTVRAEAARALGQAGGLGAVLVLRLRALIGDAEPEVVAACFAALLSLDEASGIEFLKRFLRDEGDVAGEAAIALGTTRSQRAFAVLREAYEGDRRAPAATDILTGIALTRLTEALDYVVLLVERDQSVQAVQALGMASVPDEVRQRVQRIVEATGDAKLLTVLRDSFR